MPNIEGYKLTNKGNALQIKVEAGKCKLDITKLKLGSGTASGDIVNLTDLVKVEQTVPISQIEVIDDYTCRITGLVTNQGLNKTYYIREIGLYAQDPDDGEILYLVAVDKNPDVMPADNYQMIISQEFNIDVVVSNVDSVNVTSQPVHLVTSDEVDEKIEEHNTSANPHENIFKRVLITEAKTAANTADWNTLIESRTYKITGATFAADKHQPVGAIGTGELVVLKNGDDTIVQVYYANSTEFDKAGAYHRVNIGGTWTDWVYNITNKGGTVTGDFTINGKLTVQNIEVSDSLTIGGAEPLGQDAIDKLQAQIIAPSQILYVDQKNGNDNNDGTKQSTAVRTLDKAVSLITKNIPTLTINLITYTEPENQIYNTFAISEPINNNVLKVGTFRFIGSWETYRTEHIVAKIIVPYGKTGTGVFNYNVQPIEEYYQWGRLFIRDAENVCFQSVTFEFPEDTSDTTKYKNEVIFSLGNTFEIRNIYGNTITLPANCSLLTLFNNNNVDMILFNDSDNVYITGNGFLINNVQSTLYRTDPKTTDGGNNVPGSTGTGIITKYLNNGISFTGDVLGSTKGLPSGVSAIYTKGFN